MSDLCPDGTKVGGCIQPVGLGHINLKTIKKTSVQSSKLNNEHQNTSQYSINLFTL